jgi:hypothetical protein
MINEATIARARYYPELLPDARVVSVSAGSEISPPILDLRRYEPKFLRLVNLAVETSANVEVRVRADADNYKINAGGLPDLKSARWELLGTALLYLNLYGVGSVSDYRVRFGVWVYEPSVAEKIMLGRRLDQEESRIASALNLAASVQKGVLPVPISYLLEREYNTVGEVARTAVLDLAANTEVTVGVVNPNPGEFLVLTGLAAAPGTVAQNVRIRIDRDRDADYIEIPTYPLSLDDPIQCWVPALREFRIKAIASQNVAGWAMRYEVRRCVMTNVLRVRFGLLDRERTPGETWDKTKGGIL